MSIETPWPVIYELKELKIKRVDGNPARKKYKNDTWLDWAISKK